MHKNIQPSHKYFDFSYFLLFLIFSYFLIFLLSFSFALILLHCSLYFSLFYFQSFSYLFQFFVFILSCSRLTKYILKIMKYMTMVKIRMIENMHVFLGFRIFIVVFWKQFIVRVLKIGYESYNQ